MFSKYQCGFRKGFSTQQCLLTLLEKWKRSIDRGKVDDDYAGVEGALSESKKPRGLKLLYHWLKQLFSKKFSKNDTFFPRPGFTGIYYKNIDKVIRDHDNYF